MFAATAIGHHALPFHLPPIRGPTDNPPYQPPLTMPADLPPRRARLPQAPWLRLLALLFGLLALGSAAAQAPAADCQAAALTAGDGLRGSVPLAGRLMAVDDRGKRLDIGSVTAAPGFAPVAGAVHTRSGGGSTWFRLCLQRAADAPAQWMLTVLPPYLGEVALYSPLGDGGFRLQRQGAALPRQDDGLSYRGFSFTMDLPADAPAIHYLQVSTTTSMRAELGLFQPAGLFAEVSRYAGGFGFYLGMLVLVVAINGIFWLWLRDPAQLLYAGTVAAIGLFAAITSGYAGLLLPWPVDMRLAYALSGCLMWALGGLYFSTTLKLRHRYPRRWQLNRAIVLAYCLGALAIVLQPGLVLRGVLHLVMLGHMAQVVSTAIDTYRRYPPLRLYILAFLPLVLSLVVVIVGSELGLDAGSPALLLHGSSLIHVVLLNIVLVRRVFEAERERRDAQATALRLAQESERVLEQRVEERTRSLDAANGRLTQEVAERRAVERKLQQALEAEQQANGALRRFLSMVSHEFRTPLATIQLSAQRLSRALQEQAPELLPQPAKIVRNVGRLLGLIDNLLAEDRLGAAAMNPRMEYLDLARHLRLRYGEHAGGRVGLQLPRGGVIVLGDPQLLDIAISNLIDNALKYSPASAPVNVSLAVVDDLVEVKVSDQGPGIPEGERERIFDKYYRQDRVSTKPGTGLGLHLAREFARRHGGDLTLAEAQAGQEGGATFVLHLPLAISRPSSNESGDSDGLAA